MQRRTIVWSAAALVLIVAIAVAGFAFMSLRAPAPAVAQSDQPAVQPADPNAVNVMKDPADIPAPIARLLTVRPAGASTSTGMVLPRESS